MAALRRGEDRRRRAMAEISAKEVMALRNKTGLSMMECKKALVESGGNQDAAEDLLKKKLGKKMEGRTDRAAGEGRVAVKIADDGRSAVIVELRAETDFTAKNEKFGAVAERIADLALAEGKAGGVAPTDEMKAPIEDLKISTGENVSIARIHRLEGGGGSKFGRYVHHDGKTGVLLHATGSVSDDVARDICMHIAAYVPRPQGVSRDDIPAETVEREVRLLREKMEEEGKNPEMIERIVEGKKNALYGELALLEQPFVKDESVKIKDLLKDDGQIGSFIRWRVGEAG